jgi:glycosyltransferase involved in cell wall biosynthesis
VTAPTTLRLLFLLPFPPRLEGRHGGARATGQLIASLAARHEVAVLYRAEGAEQPEEELRAACALLESVAPHAPPGRLRPKLALLRGIPTWASEVANPLFAERVRALSGEWAPDVVQVEYPVMGQYLPALGNSRAVRVLVDHDASVRDLRTWHGPLAPLTGWLDERAFRRFEKRSLDDVDAVVVFTDRDRRALEALDAGTPVTTIPLGIRVPDQQLDPVGAAPPTVLFVGSFGHAANTDAALWLGEELFPPVRDAVPDATLTIVGPDPPAEVRALAREGVEVTGEVPDVRPYLDAAAVVAAPIRVGGGMRVKVLEALAAGKAVVATPLAVEGLHVVDGEQVRVAADAGGFSEALRELVVDRDERVALAGRARSWASAHAGWDSAMERYEALYRSLLERESS